MLEIILVLVLIGIVGAFSVSIFSKVVASAAQGSMEQQMAEEAYWAETRMVSILGMAVSGSCPTPGQITAGMYDFATDSTNEVNFTFNNGQVLYNGVLLWDRVNSFSASFEDHLFSIDIRLEDAGHPALSLDIFARNSL